MDFFWPTYAGLTTRRVILIYCRLWFCGCAMLYIWLILLLSQFCHHYHRWYNHNVITTVIIIVIIVILKIVVIIILSVICVHISVFHFRYSSLWSFFPLMQRCSICSKCVLMCSSRLVHTCLAWLCMKLRFWCRKWYVHNDIAFG